MPIYKKSLLMLAVVVAAAAVVMIHEYNQADEGVELATDELIATAATDVSDEKTEILVYVSGAVNNPGVVSMPEGARAAEAIEKCGGTMPTADMNSVNMAQVLKDGAQIKVSEKNSTVAINSKTGSEQGNMVNINQADAKALESLPGIGPAMAQRIVEYRNENGSFQSVDDLQKVKGIGKAKLEKLKDRITV